MDYRVHFIGLKVNKNLDWQLTLLLSVYFWCLNEKSPICGVAEKFAILTTKRLLRLQIFLRLASGQLLAQTRYRSGTTFGI